MPLKTQLCASSGEVIEQIVFSNIDLPERIPNSMFKPLVDASSYRWLRADRQLASNATPPALWEAMRLPPGFRMATRSAQALPGSSEPVAHLVFTDGIASVSVFVEPRKPDTKATEGPARVGSSSAFSTVIDDHQVTAVGEVPPNTVKFIATQVKASKAATEGLGIAAGSAPEVTLPRERGSRAPAGPRRREPRRLWPVRGHAPRPRRAGTLACPPAGPDRGCGWRRRARAPLWPEGARPAPRWQRDLPLHAEFQRAFAGPEAIIPRSFLPAYGSAHLRIPDGGRPTSSPRCNAYATFRSSPTSTTASPRWRTGSSRSAAGSKPAKCRTRCSIHSSWSVNAASPSRRRRSLSITSRRRTARPTS